MQIHSSSENIRVSGRTCIWVLFIAFQQAVLADSMPEAEPAASAVSEELVVPDEELARIGGNRLVIAPTAENPAPESIDKFAEASPEALVQSDTTMPVPEALPQASSIEAASTVTLAQNDPGIAQTSTDLVTDSASEAESGGAALMRKSGETLRELPRKAWDTGKKVVKGAVRDLRQPPPDSPHSKMQPMDMEKSCTELYYETMELVQTQHGYRSRSQYWDDNRNQAVGFLGTVFSPVYYVWGVTATQSYHRSRDDIALNARIDALRHASARKGCFLR